MSRFLLSKRPTLLAILLLMAVCGSAGAVGVRRDPKKRAARQTVEALEEQWRIAQLKGDPVAMDRLLSDDYVGITAFGQVTTKAQQLARVRDRSVVLTRLELSDIKVKLIGPIVAVVTSRAEVNGTSDGVSVNGAFRYTRVYQHLPGSIWRITSFEATRVPNEGPHRPRTEAEAAARPSHP